MSARPKPDPVGPGQQSVWDFPRPPALVPCALPIEVVLGGEVICRTSATWQVLETSHPPSFYLPRSDFIPGALLPAGGTSWCEWKGQARYLDVHGGGRTAAGKAWYYPSPTRGFTALVDHVALYPGAMDGCFVDGEPVLPQPGGFYGGWITPWVAGPFKGVPGSTGW